MVGESGGSELSGALFDSRRMMPIIKNSLVNNPTVRGEVSNHNSAIFMQSSVGDSMRRRRTLR
jgi:hypothetical protein